MKYYSIANESFYDDIIHVTLPADAVSMTDTEHAQIFTDISNGLQLIWSAAGPYTQAYPAPTPEEITAAATASANASALDYLNETAHYVHRHVEHAVAIPTDIATARHAAFTQLGLI